VLHEGSAFWAGGSLIRVRRGLPEASW